MLELQHAAGNRAVGRLLRAPAIDVKGAAKKVGIDTDKPPSDDVDDFLDSRTGLFKVVLAGSMIKVTIARDKEFTERYTETALTLAATTAAVRAVYGRQVPVADVVKARAKLLGQGRATFYPAREKQTGLEAHHITLIDDSGFNKLAEALGLPVSAMQKDWRAKRGEARMLAFALGSALRSFDKLEPRFDKRLMEKADISPQLVRQLIDKRFDTMIEVAKRDPAAQRWRAAFARNKELVSGDRSEPKLEDFDQASLDEWADSVLRLAIATRKVLGEQWHADRQLDMRNFRNEHLRPHEVKDVKDPADYILRNFEGQHAQQLEPYDWVVRGGMTLTNARNQPIYLLRADSRGVLFQNMADKRFYEQSLEGLGQEILYGIYSLAGQKSLGAIKLTQWVIGVAGAIFPPVRYTIIATDVINAAVQIDAHRVELADAYDELKLAYANIDKLVPGLLPKVWHAVLDTEGAELLDPRAHPDAGAWFKALLRLVVHHYAHHVIRTTYAAEAVDGFLSKAWAAIKKALGIVAEVLIHVIVVGPAVAGSIGPTQELATAVKRLAETHIADVEAVVKQLAALSPADKDRLVREMDELQRNGFKVADIVRKSLEW